MTSDSTSGRGPLPPLPGDDATLETVEAASLPAATLPSTADPVRRRSRLEDGRRLRPAGEALVVAVLALVLGALLNAAGLHKSATGQPDGWKRDVAMAVTGPLADVSGALRLDRPRAWLKDGIGREGDDRIDATVVVPPPQTGAGPVSGTPAKRLAFTPERPLRLWVAGDSLAIVPGESVVAAAGPSPVIEAVEGVDGRIATGLERPDVFNWFTHVRARMKELRPKAVVFLLGGNDDHGYVTGLREGASIDHFGGPLWTKEYRRRVGGLMDTATRGGAYVVWVGLPITRDADQSRRYDVINAIVQQEAKKRAGRVAFVDTYATFASDAGEFTEYLPSSAGRLIKMRAPDGVHFERAGGDVIAREVLRHLNEAYDLTSWRRGG